MLSPKSIYLKQNLKSGIRNNKLHFHKAYFLLQPIHKYLQRAAAEVRNRPLTTAAAAATQQQEN